MNRIVIVSCLAALLLSLTVIGAADSSEWKTVTVEGYDFRIPPAYQAGVLEDDGSAFEVDNGATFALYCIDEFIDRNYGYAASSGYEREDLTIGSHEVVFFHDENSISRAYFSCGESIFYLGWDSEEMTPEIEEIIKTSEDSNLSESQFHEILDLAQKVHDDAELQDLTSNSYRYPLVGSDNHQEDSSYLIRYYNYFRHVYGY